MVFASPTTRGSALFKPSIFTPMSVAMTGDGGSKMAESMGHTAY